MPTLTREARILVLAGLTLALLVAPTLWPITLLNPLYNAGLLPSVASYDTVGSIITLALTVAVHLASRRVADSTVADVWQHVAVATVWLSALLVLLSALLVVSALLS